MKFKVLDNIQSLHYFSWLINKSEKIELQKELEIEAFTKWSVEFSSTYWYLKYLLLKNKKVEIAKDEINKDYYAFFNETQLNLIWLNILDIYNFQIEIIDGECYVYIFNAELISIIGTMSKWIKVE